MKKISFSFEIRQAMQVAMAVARSRGDRDPSLLGIRGEVPTFHFEGGLVVKVHLIDEGGTQGPYSQPMEGWVVTSVELRYWAGGEEKVSEVWGSDRLRALQQDSAFGWYHPHVGDPAEVEAGFVGVFWDNPRGEGYISVDPGGSQSCRNMVAYFDYTYGEGDRERAIQKAKDKLAEIQDRAEESVKGTVFEGR